MFTGRYPICVATGSSTVCRSTKLMAVPPSSIQNTPTSVASPMLGRLRPQGWWVWWMWWMSTKVENVETFWIASWDWICKKIDFCSEEIRIFAQRFLLFTCPTPHLQTFGEAYSVVVEEGETVVLPARWWHWAKSLTPSITLMRRYAGWVWYLNILGGTPTSDGCEYHLMAKNGKTCHLTVVIHHFQTLPAATNVFCLSKRIRWVL